MLSCAPLLVFGFELAAGQLTLPEMFNKAPCNPKGLAYLGIFLQVHGLHIDVKNSTLLFKDLKSSHHIGSIIMDNKYITERETKFLPSASNVVLFKWYRGQTV